MNGDLRDLRTQGQFVLPPQGRDEGRVCHVSYPSSACTKKDREGGVD